MKAIMALSRKHFWDLIEVWEVTDDNIEDLPFAFISIMEEHEEEEPKLFHFKLQHPNFIQMSFSDINRTEILNKTPFSPISPLQAYSLVNFILDNSNKPRGFIIHCTAGISRSGAIATFILDLFQEQNYSRELYENFRYMNSLIIPNTTVMRELRAAYKRIKESN